MEQRELDAVTQVRDAVQMVEKAMMEKEQVSFLYISMFYLV
jgi:hypothetical protein